METLHINGSMSWVTQKPFNQTDWEKTVFEICKDMQVTLIWYLCLQFINMFLGIPANIMVLWLIKKNKGVSCTSDIFTFHLAILDVLFCLVPLLELCNIFFITASIAPYILRFFYGLKDCSPLFLSCICLNRYMAVVHPITFTKLKDRRHRTVLVMVVWLVILAYAAAYCANNILNFEKVFTAMILATFAFMVFCNVTILWALWQSRPGRDEMHPVKKRAFKIVLVTLAIIVFNYFPLVALLPFQHHFSSDVFHCYVHNVASSLMDISSSIQPMLYLSKEKMPCSNCCQTGTSHEP